jgi:hypothetical protein
VQASPAGQNDWSTLAHAVSTQTGITVTGKTANTLYDYRVRGNSAGPGPFSNVATNSTTAPPIVVPGHVTRLTAGNSTTTTQPLSWAAPSTGGTATDYEIQWSPAGANTWTTFGDGVSTATSATVTGLASGKPFDYRVRGLDSAGAGAWSSAVTHSTAGITETYTAPDGTSIVGKRTRR